ncbi:Retrovirus-related Pol polyprotein from transposon 17.6 [Takifugu flavidus]|uniref:ribonuclease H n=1 Tax=Takifugu flavidus TaxID=433684 RepID=A0A5C6MD47_9TELE|nr:Retrovirus-related Pol polyprotein from transposon 17.6 [Takifugu flavidus]
METAMTQNPCITQKQSPLLHQNCLSPTYTDLSALPYGYRVVLMVVRKKNGDIRLCVDYRKLNLNTIKDAYALPNLEEAFSALTGSKWFSVLDLKSGYYQIEVDETDKHKTAFICPMGFFEFNRMPQGITNAPSTFQRLMEKCMCDINLREVLVFLDDLIVFSDTLEQHESRLLNVLSRLKEYGVKGEQLAQPASVTVQPGQRLTITCQVSYSLNSYGTNWIRQPAGKGLEWIGCKYTGGSYYKASLKNKFASV